MKNNTLRLVRIAIIMALYVALSLSFAPLTFGLIQVRFSEALLLLCFFNKDYCYSLVGGCMIVNFFSPLGIIDVIFGTIGTLLTVICIRYSRRLYLASIPAVVFTSIVALEFYFVASEPFWLSFLTIGVGEFIAVGVVGVPLFYLLCRNKKFLELINADSRYFAIKVAIDNKREERRLRKKGIDTTDTENNVNAEIELYVPHDDIRSSDALDTQDNEEISEDRDDLEDDDGHHREYNTY